MPQNISALILRYLNILYLVGIPLFFSTQNNLTSTLFLVGAGGISFLLLGLFLPALGNLLIKYYFITAFCVLVIYTIGLILVTNGIIIFSIFTIGAFVLGFSTANCEIRCVYNSVYNKEYSDKAKFLQVYNMLKVMGIALGFSSAALLSGGVTSIYISITLTALMLLVLSLSIITEIFKKINISTNVILNIGFSSFTPIKGIYIFLFVMDVSVFTFWYIFLPEKLISKGFKGVEILVYLVIQSLFHASFQIVWRKLILKIGAMFSYWISFISHLAIITWIGYTEFGFYEGLLLFSIMGILNSGTFLASSLLFYKNKITNLGDNYLHLGASHTGKFIGASII